MKKVCFTLLMASLVCTSTVLGADWPNYLGPNYNATSSETGLADKWPEDGPEVLWTVDLGPGYGAPAVMDGKAYVLDRIGDEKDVMRCFDVESGKEEWRYEYDAPGRVGHAGSRSVPSVNEKYVYSLGPHGDVYCFDKSTHKPVWHKSLAEDFGDAPRLSWGYGQNPLLFNNMLIVAPMTDEAGIVALNPETGDVIWKSALPGRAGYASPIPVKISGEDHIVMISAQGRGRGRQEGEKGGVVGYDPKTGKQLWHYDGWQCTIPIPNVIEVGGDRLFITGGYRAGAALFKVVKQDDGYGIEEIYTTEEFSVHCHPPLLIDGYLYAHCSTNETKDGMVCMSLDGEIQWKTERDPYFDKGGLLYADGRIYNVDGHDGYLYMVDPTPESFKPISKVKMFEGREEIWAPLTLVNGKLLIRDQSILKCVNIAE